MTNWTDDVADVEAAVDRFARKRTMRKLARLVLRQQQKLHKMVSAKAWDVYLKLEEAVNERDFELVDAG